MDADGLHLGFDRNTTSNSRMYYNVSGSWSFVSVLPGTFMIRPLIGNITVGVEENSSKSSISIYPNPVSDYIYISGSDDPEAFYSITDAHGREVMRTRKEKGVDVSSLAAGTYTISEISDKNVSQPQRFVINR